MELKLAQKLVATFGEPLMTDSSSDRLYISLTSRRTTEAAVPAMRVTKAAENFIIGNKIEFGRET